MSEISDEDWAKEFDVINSNKGGKAKGKGKGKSNSKKSLVPDGDDFISFREFVAYTLKNIIKPAVYIAGVGASDDIEDEGGGDGGEKEGNGSAPNAFVRMMSDLIDAMEENDQEEAKQEKALAELEKSEEDVEKEGGPEGEVDPAAFIQEAIKANQVTIFSKSFCPFCVKTKETLSTLENVTIKTFELVCNSSGTIELQLKSQQ